jgi:elongation factor G
MPSPDLAKIRNIGVIAHIDAGKTTTTEHILFYSGAKHRLGEVDAGTTDTDYDPEEQDRGITIYSACIPFTWRGCTVNLIDTPGHVDFTAEVERSLRVLDGCVVVFDAQKGVEAQSETVWRQADKYGVPRLVFVNKMDVVGANFANVLDEIRDRLEGRPAAVTIPIGSGSAKDSPTPFEAIIDLIEMKALRFNPKDEGKTVAAGPIPEPYLEAARRWREQLFDILTERDEKDRLTTALLEGREIPAQAIRDCLREQTLKRYIQPVFCGSGREHIGVQPVMDAVAWYLPSPVDRPPVIGVNPKKEKEETRKPDPKEPFAGLVFKIVADPHGELFYLRIYSGTLKAQSRPWNPGKDRKEMVSKIYHIFADPTHREELPEAYAGDIVALIGLKDSVTGDTLCDAHHPILLEPIQFAEAVISRSIEPESSADKQKLVDTLTSLKREDPTFDWRVDQETGQTLMSGMGMLHLEIKQKRMERDFRMRVRVGKPRVSYRETIQRDARAEGEFNRQIAQTQVHARINLSVGKKAIGKGQTDAGKGDGAARSVEVPIEYALEGKEKSDFAPATIAALEQGIRGALSSGWFGYPVIALRVGVRGIEDSGEVAASLNETAVQAAAAEAVHEALRDNVVLLEPVMHLEVTVPEEYLGPVTADLNARRAEITEVMARSKLRVIEALVPLARTFDYSEKVRSLSQGRADWTMEPHAYAPAPEDVLKGFFGET